MRDSVKKSSTHVNGRKERDTFKKALAEKNNNNKKTDEYH